MMTRPAPGVGEDFDRIRRRIGAIAAPVLFLLVLLAPVPGIDGSAQRLAAVMVLVITLWVTEVFPLAITALAGPTLAVMLGVAPARAAFAPFADPLIFLFIGSFIIAQAIFVHRLNERIAYGVMSWRVIGAHPGRILVAYACIAAFISAWMSNTATAAMLMPVGLSLLTFMETEGNVDRRYGVALMLAMAYGCSMGGIATIVGTPPNVIAVGMLAEQAGVEITFVDWVMFAGPIAVLMVGVLVAYLWLVGARGLSEVPGADRIIIERKRALGPLGRAEKNVLGAFLIVVSLWIIPGVLSLVLGSDHPVSGAVTESIPISVAAIIGAVLLFILPIDAERRSTITWNDAARIDWGTVLLFGGGLALGQMTFDTGLAEAFGRGMTEAFGVSSLVSVTFVSALFATLMSETMSNTAAANIAVPIIISISLASGVDPVPPVVAASLAASISVVFPVSTPPNAIVYSSGKVPITQMVRHGLVMDLAAITIIPTMVLLFLS